MKVIHGNIMVYISFAALKYFSLSINQVVRNTAPFFALLLASMFLNEHPTLSSFTLLLVTLAAALMVIFGGGPLD